MFHIRAILVLSLLTTASLATPIKQVSRLRAARAESQLLSRQGQQALSTPVTFQTVTTTQTEAGTITTTCDVKLSPVTAADGSTQVLEEKQCKVKVDTGGTPSSSSSGNGGGNDANQTSTAPSATGTASQSRVTLSSFSASVTATTATSLAPAISEIGVGTIPASATGTVSAPSGGQTSSPSATASASGSAPPAVSVIGTNQIPSSATGTVLPVSTSDSTSGTTPVTSGTTPVTSVTTLSDGQVSTSISTPSAAAAEQAAATTPGQKLEVLPIGLGVFAGVSVIALIVVGLVTYERTKYRKAFRQRKLAEAGANMGYGGMAERT